MRRGRQWIAPFFPIPFSPFPFSSSCSSSPFPFSSPLHYTSPFPRCKSSYAAWMRQRVWDIALIGSISSRLQCYCSYKQSICYILRTGNVSGCNCIRTFCVDMRAEGVAYKPPTSPRGEDIQPTLWPSADQFAVLRGFSRPFHSNLTTVTAICRYQSNSNLPSVVVFHHDLISPIQ